MNRINSEFKLTGISTIQSGLVDGEWKGEVIKDNSCAIMR